MRQTLFSIPTESIAGVPLFGFGWLLAAWAVVSVVLLVWLVRRQGWTSDTWGWLPVLLLVGAAIAFLGPRLAQDGALPIRGFGAMLLLAIVSGVGLSAWRAKRCGWDPEIVYSLCFWLCLSGVVGARLFYIIEYWDDFRGGSPGQTLVEIFNIAQGGIVFYGSIIGGAIAGIVYVTIYRIPFLAMGDILAPGIALGVGIGRLGCFLNGCCYGGACEAPWAVQFPAGSPAHIQQVRRGEVYLHGLKFGQPPEGPAVIARVEPGSPAEAAGLRAGDRVDQINGLPIMHTREAWGALLRPSDHPDEVSVRLAGQASPHTFSLPPPPERSLPVHPTQLYSAIGGVLICLVLVAYDPLRRRDGEVLALLAILYPIERFMIEILRADEPGVFNTGLTISQNISIGLFVVGLALWAYTRTRPLGSYRAAAAV